MRPYSPIELASEFKTRSTNMLLPWHPERLRALAPSLLLTISYYEMAWGTVVLGIVMPLRAYLTTVQYSNRLFKIQNQRQKHASSMISRTAKSTSSQLVVDNIILWGGLRNCRDANSHYKASRFTNSTIELASEFKTRSRNMLLSWYPEQLRGPAAKLTPRTGKSYWLPVYCLENMWDSSRNGWTGK